MYTSYIYNVHKYFMYMYTHIYSEFNPSNKRFISTHVYGKSFTPQWAIHPGSVFLHESKSRGGMVSRFLLVLATGVDWHVITEVALCTTSLPGDLKWSFDTLVGFRGKRLHNIYTFKVLLFDISKTYSCQNETSVYTPIPIIFFLFSLPSSPPTFKKNHPCLACLACLWPKV